MNSDDEQLPEWLKQIRDTEPGQRIKTPEKLSTASTTASLHPKTVLEEKVDSWFSVKARILIRSVKIARLAMLIGLVVSAIIWVILPRKSSVVNIHNRG